MQREMQQKQEQEWEKEQGAEEGGGAAAGRAEVLTLSEDPETAALEVSIPLPLPHAQTASALMSEGEALIQHQPAPSVDALVDAVMQVQSQAASAVRSRLNTPHLESAGGGLETVGEEFANRDRPLERLIVEADELAQRLPDKHVAELLSAIERGSTPVARAVRSRTPTPLVLRERQDNMERLIVEADEMAPLVLREGQDAMERLIMESDELAQRLPEEHVVELLAAIERGSTPVARAVRSRTPLVLREGQDIIGAVGASESSGHDEEALPNLVQDASLILAAIEGPANSGSGMDDRSSVLSTLHDMAGSEGQGSFVARMLYLDLVTSCRSVADGGAMDGSMSPQSQEHFRELLIQGRQMIQGLEEHHARSVMDAISGGFVTCSPLASVLYLQLLLGVEVDDEMGMRSVLRNTIAQCRNVLRQLFGEMVPVNDGVSSSAASSRPQSRAFPRRRFRDTRSPRTKAGEEFLNSAIETVIYEIARQEIAELCHHNLRTRITEWSGILDQSKEGVKELQELISGEERANAHRQEPLQEEDVDESSFAPSDTYYTFKLCEQGDMNLVVGTIRLAADTKWAQFEEAVKEQLGYSISSIRYDDDFGPKQAKDIFCTNKGEWKELRNMMEEDKEEIQDVLTVEVFKVVDSVGSYRVKLHPCEEGASVGLEDLKEMLSTCCMQLQMAQKAVLECKRRLKASWKYYSPSEYESLERMQGVVRATCIRRAFCKSREKVLFALHIFRPPILRYWQSLHFKNRHTISSIKLQSAFRGRKARKFAYIATVEAAATSTLMDVAMGMIYSVSEEERAIHKEWIIVDATNAARDFQRFIRLKMSPSRETIIAQHESEDRASYFIVRFFRAIHKRKSFYRAAIAAVTTENVLFGPAMERAFKELLKEGKAQHVQAVFRRIAVQQALEGYTTSASDELATTWAVQDLVLWVLESQDEMYEEPRRIHALTWLQAFVWRSVARKSFGLVYFTALMFQTTSRRCWHQLEWRRQYNAIKTLNASLVRQKHRNWHCKLCYTACKVQDRARSMRLVYATRRFKKMVDHLVDVVRSNLYRRFYTHILLVGGHQTSVLQIQAASADYNREREAAWKRDEQRKAEAQRLAEEAGKKRGGRRKDEKDGPSEMVAITRLSSVDKLAKLREEDERIAQVSRIPSELIFMHSLGAVIETTFDVINTFVSLQPKSDGNFQEETEEHHADSAEKSVKHTEGADADCAENIQERLSSEWFKTSTSGQTLQQFCETQLKGMKSQMASSVRQHFLFWLQANFEIVANRWQNCQSAACVVLEVADALLTLWARRSWIRNPGFMSLEVDDLKQTFDAFMMLFKDSSLRFAKMLKQFPNIAFAPALLQSLQDSCIEAMKNVNGQLAQLQWQSKSKSGVDEEEDNHVANLKTQLTWILNWLNKDQESLFRRVDQSFHTDPASAFWAGVFSDLMKYCYSNGHITEVPPLTVEDLMANIQQYSAEFDSDYHAIETPFQTYDGLWTLIFAGQDDYMDTTREFTWTPEGYALNASSGELVPVEAPDTQNVKSIFSVVHSLSWEFEKQLATKLLPCMRHIHPVGFLGALSARRRRDRLQMWTALAIETTVCKFLNYAIRIAEGHTLVTVLRVFTILCLRPGRGTLLFQAGCVELLNRRVVGGESSEEVELSSAAAFALQSFLSDVYVASQVKTQTALDIAEQLKHPVHGTMHVSIVYCLQLIIRNNESCKMELARQTWLHGILLTLIRMKDGPQGLVASVAMLIAMLSYDAEVARLFGKDPETIFELILMLRDATDIVSRQSSLTALSSLGLSPENIDIMIQHHAFHDTLMGILATQSLQLFPLSASLAVKFVENARMCNATMQYPKVLNALLNSMTFSDVRISAPATEVLMALTSSIEKAWVLVDSAKQHAPKDLQNLVVAAGQVEQFGVNSFAMSTICHAIVSSFPNSQPYAARAFRSILRCSITACDWVLSNQVAMQILLDGIRHRDETVQEYCILSIYDLSARNKGAAAVVQRGGFVQLKVLLYTDAAPKLQVGVIRSLKHFLLGLDRVAGPDDELIRRITELLRSDNESVQDACVDILAKMIQQDYIDLFVNVHAASNCPQSDNWGYCDPFVKMRINGQEHQTPVLRNTLNPEWNFSCRFSISDKSDELKVELYDWDNTGPEVLGEILELSCERLHELGTELGLYSVGRALSEKATTLRNEAEQKASTVLDEARAKAMEINQNAEVEATKIRDELLEEARFIGSDSKAEAKLILNDAAAKGMALIEAAAGQGRQVEFRAQQQAQKLKEEAKKKAAQVEKAWQDTVQDIEDIKERIKQLKKQAKSKYDRIRKEASHEADKILYHGMKESQKIRISSSEDADRILSLKEGWHIVMEKNRNELTGQELMGPNGDIQGFDDNGKVVGAGGKPLQTAPTVLKITFEYNINVNVDEIIFDQSWIVGRLFDLLALKTRQVLRENTLILMRALTEDVKESRLAFGQYPGALELFSDILATPGQDSCYVEICKLVWQLLYEPDNRMPIYKSPLMDHLKNMRTLQRWKGSAVAVIAKDSIAKLEKHAERVRKMEKKQKKENRQQEAANRLKKINAAASPTSSSPRSPNTISPEQSQESLVGSQLSQVSVGSIEPTQADKHKRHLRKRGQGSPNNSDISLESDAKEKGPVPIFEGPKAEPELDEVDLYADPDYEEEK